ncbi:MAG: hypothetical protein R3303_00390 [Marinobacter sp.]|nr:hypothetical protein [Marinobacter sp.]
MLLVRVTLVLALLLLSGCAAFEQRSEMSRFNSAYQQGRYDQAAQAMAIADSGKATAGDEVFELLHRGEAYRLSGRFEQSISSYDQAEAGMKDLDTESMVSTAGQGALSVLVNDSTRQYHALMADAVLVNTYKALDFLCLGDPENARVELNRADDRTRRAVNFFADEIRAQKARVREDNRTSARLVDDNLASPAVRSALDEQYGNPAGWQVYSSFIVPFSTYLHGLYFLANATGPSDYERARTSLVRVADMMPDNPTLAADARLAEQLANGRSPTGGGPGRVWVVYENGLGPVLQEVRVGVPLIIHEGRVQAPAYFGLALPRYMDRSVVPGALTATTSNGDRVETRTIATMGRVVRTEMQARFPGILTRAIASALIKAVVQGEAADKLGAAGQLASMIYAIATTQADIRSWQATPDHWSVARLDRPADGQLSLGNTVSGYLGSLRLPDWPYTLVYVKQPTGMAPATVMVLDLQGSAPARVLTLDRQDGARSPATISQN